MSQKCSWLELQPASARKRQLTPASLSQFHQSQPALVGVGRPQLARWSASASFSKQQKAVGWSVGASQPASQPGQPDRQTDTVRAASQSSRQLGRQVAASEIASELTRQVGRQYAAGASLQQAVFFGAVLCSTSPPVETRLTVYRRSQHVQTESELRIWLKSNALVTRQC